MGFDIRQAMINSIERTNDPLAAIKMQDGYAAVSSVGKMLVPMGKLDKVEAITDRLLKDFTEEELDKANPDLVIALCGMLSEALLRLAQSFGK